MLDLGPIPKLVFYLGIEMIFKNLESKMLGLAALAVFSLIAWTIPDAKSKFWEQGRSWEVQEGRYLTRIVDRDAEVVCYVTRGDSVSVSQPFCLKL